MLKSFCIPGKPFAWKRAQYDRRSGRRFTNKAAEAHQRECARIAAQAWGDAPPLFGAVKLLCIATFEIPASWPKALRAAAQRGDIFMDSDPDFDNIAKQIADAIKFVAFVDDNQIGDGRAILRYGEAARTECWIGPIGSPEHKTPAQARREARWAAGGYAAAMAKAPAGWLLNACVRNALGKGGAK